MAYLRYLWMSSLLRLRICWWTLIGWLALQLWPDHLRFPLGDQRTSMQWSLWAYSVRGQQQARLLLFTLATHGYKKGSGTTRVLPWSSTAKGVATVKKKLVRYVGVSTTRRSKM